MAFGYEEFTMSQNAANERVRRAQEEEKAYQRARQEKMDANIASMFSNGGGAGPSTDNRFGAGLSDVESRLRALLDNPDSIQQTGAYKFRVKQGEEALQRSLGARGLLNSGNRLMELTKYGQDMGSQEYDNQASRLSSLLGTYGQGYMADRNANINAANSENANRLGYANLWGNMFARNQAQSPQVISRGSSGFSSMPSLGAIGGAWDPKTDPAIQKMERDAGWKYDYSQGGQSLWRNTATGETAWSAGGREGNPTGGEYYNTPAWNRNGG